MSRYSRADRELRKNRLSVQFERDKSTIIQAPLRLNGIVCFAIVCLVSTPPVCFGGLEKTFSGSNRSQPPAPAISCTEAAGLAEAARLLHSQGELKASQEALARYSQALSCWRSTQEHRNAAETLRVIGDIHYETGQYQAARDSYRQALAES